MTPAQTEENDRLRVFHTRVRAAIEEIGDRLAEYAQEIRTRTEYMWEARRDMDHIEKIAVRQIIEQSGRSADMLQKQQQRLARLARSPYFGRFDFASAGTQQAKPVYVGVHHYHDDPSGQTLVHDWRAPIAALFYDHEIGPASYRAPSGEICGEVRLKRQFRIQEGVIELMFDSGVNVVDELLQQELGRAADDGMRNIVATIQRDQNAIVRNDEAHTLIIQGVAGSGKTSIALHRIAYLLYRFKDTLSADDILIISPNRVFADYIGNVLPELGEEQVTEVGMETLAEELLANAYRFQSFIEQTTALLERDDEALRERIAFKAGLDFLKRIDGYVEYVETSSFVAVQWRSGRKIVPDWFFDESWRKHRGIALTARVARVVAATEQQIMTHYRAALTLDERRSLREAVRAMVRPSTLRETYRGLFDWLGRPELFRPAGGRLEYADVFPLIHLKLKLEGVENPRHSVKHLLIDEMQDYTPLQYAVLAKLFRCRKTILGDAAQSVNPYSAASAEQIHHAVGGAATVRLTRSYRSTWEIMQFALAISPNPELVAMERHGPEPAIHVFRRPVDARNCLLGEIAEFLGSSHRTLAVIAKTQRQAAKAHAAIVAADIKARLLDAKSSGYSAGIFVCTAHLAKGLEFDRVVIVDVDPRNYASPMDRNLLYVACTRAMHRLTLIAVGAISSLLNRSTDASDVD